MAVACKCDRCGKYHDPYTDTFNQIELKTRLNERAIKSGKSYDLCPECHDELVAWLDNVQSVNELED